MSKYLSKSKIQWFLATLVIVLCIAAAYTYQETDLLDFIKVEQQTTTTNDKTDAATVVPDAPQTSPIPTSNTEAKSEVGAGNGAATTNNTNYVATPTTTSGCYKIHPDSDCLSPEINQAILDLQKVPTLPLAQ